VIVMKFPSITRVASALRELNQDLPGYGDVRLVVGVGGNFALWPAIAAIPGDEGDCCGVYAVPGLGKRFDAERIAKELLNQARAQAAARAVPEPDKASAPKLRFPSIEAVAKELREANAAAECPRTVRLSIETKPLLVEASGWSWCYSNTGTFGLWAGRIYGEVTVPGKGKRFDARDAARQLLVQARRGPRRSPEEDARADAIIEEIFAVDENGER
jgi:hypothetical protein